MHSVAGLTLRRCCRLIHGEKKKFIGSIVQLFFEKWNNQRNENREMMNGEIAGASSTATEAKNSKFVNAILGSL